MPCLPCGHSARLVNLAMQAKLSAVSRLALPTAILVHGGACSAVLQSASAAAAVCVAAVATGSAPARDRGVI